MGVARWRSRATLELEPYDGQIRGAVILTGGAAIRFDSAHELERALVECLASHREAGRFASPRSPLWGLGTTETAVAEAAAGGASNREIAQTLHYSVKSVEAYLTRIYRKLGIDGRNELLVLMGAEIGRHANPLEPETHRLRSDAPRVVPLVTSRTRSRS